MSLSQEQLSRWRDRVIGLGLDPDTDANDCRIDLHTKSLEEYTKWFNHPPHPAPEASDLTSERLERMPDALFRRHVVRHVFGESPITDPVVVAAVEKRIGRFYASVLVAPDRKVTAADPLIINSANVITVYGTVTIETGGYIQILVPAAFQCINLIKIQGGSGPGPAYDVSIIGPVGKAADPGTSPKQPDVAKQGDSAACDCCGGTVSRRAQKGADGTDGSDGGDAQSHGGDGGGAPQVSFTVSDNLGSFISFLNKGGDGGRGGNGGEGAQGGKGGKGGNGTSCGAYKPDGAKGGTGGQGGNGGNAGNGGNGGTGAQLKVYVPASQQGNVSITTLKSNGGEKGIRGLRGGAGPGGDAGDRNGTAGDNGKQGATDGQDGNPGDPGAAGTSYLNGQVV